MFGSLGRFVSRRWLAVILVWIVLLVAARLLAPSWDRVTYDGDFAYLPSRVPSVAGARLLAEAFPHERAKSQIVLIVARQDGPAAAFDRIVACDLARRFHNIHGIASFAQSRRLADEAIKLKSSGDMKGARYASLQADIALQRAKTAFDEALWMEEQLETFRAADGSSHESDLPPRFAQLFHNRALLLDHEGQHEKAAEQRERAALVNPDAEKFGAKMLPLWAADFPVHDVWTWRKRGFGEKLLDRRGEGENEEVRARLVILYLKNEFMAVDNLRVMEQVESELENVNRSIVASRADGVRVGVSGSAAVGSDLLRASAESIRNTHLVAVLLVALILLAVYRSPLLVAVPLLTIVVSYLIAISVVAALTQLGTLPGFGWWDFKVFKTTNIFIVVVLYGAGTDYCLFLISRYREELTKGLKPAEATVKALSSVGDALAASALTTIIGLSMMFFAEFGKFRYSGPAIGICLAITLAACITLTPAVLRACGKWLFWPWGVGAASVSGKPSASGEPTHYGRFDFVWQRLARTIVAHPGLILVACLLLLAPWAGYGTIAVDNVTYNFLDALDRQRPSRQGTELLRRHFDVGESGPVIVLARKDGAFTDDTAKVEHYEGRKAIWSLTGQFYEVNQDKPRVQSVRSLAAPLGRPPGNESFRFDTLVGKNARVVKSHFISQAPDLEASVARFEIVLQHDAFSREATETLSLIDERLRRESENPKSFWYGASFSYTGTTAAIRDLRSVTQSDTRSIKVLVVLAVALVLLIILGRPVVCLYMILSVLFTYYVTIGMTELFFRTAYGDAYQGLDWKVPIFLFVILVAIGQDYNVYLATRVFEEQKQHGPLEGLRRAVVSTGGIITSCGVIMAGTFISMTSGTWGYILPDWVRQQLGWSTSGGPLCSIVELGFALSLGVLLDTFVVRTILLPAFLALLCRWQEWWSKRMSKGAAASAAS